MSKLLLTSSMCAVYSPSRLGCLELRHSANVEFVLSTQDVEIGDTVHALPVENNPIFHCGYGIVVTAALICRLHYDIRICQFCLNGDLRLLVDRIETGYFGHPGRHRRTTMHVGIPGVATLELRPTLPAETLHYLDAEVVAESHVYPGIGTRIEAGQQQNDHHTFICNKKKEEGIKYCC